MARSEKIVPSDFLPDIPERSSGIDVSPWKCVHSSAENGFNFYFGELFYFFALPAMALFYFVGAFLVGRQGHGIDSLRSPLVHSKDLLRRTRREEEWSSAAPPFAFFAAHFLLAYDEGTRATQTISASLRA